MITGKKLATIMTKRESTTVSKNEALETVPVSALRLFDGNPKKFTSQKYKLLVASIKERGILQPLVVNRKTMTVLDGNQRMKAAMQLGLKEVQVVFGDYDEADEPILVAMFNETRFAIDEDGMYSILNKYQSDAWVQVALEQYQRMANEGQSKQPVEFEVVKNVDESYDYVVFLTKKSVDFLNMQTFFNLRNVYDMHKEKQIGLGRVVDGEALSKLISFAVASGYKNIDELP